ncbi:MAG: HlyD family type I secretion periplasmic adaptor subunit [Candidatus Riflebacteria bacterium]|nr:HlyD family type I secretion periplasmic adaptor subunit [Candidatus Riflebacteria bacterium]
MTDKTPESILEANFASVTEAPVKSRLLIYLIFIMVLTFIIWANYSQLDEITRGIGKIIPSSKNQVVQHLEGGIVTEIFVRQGDSVEVGQPLLRIENMMWASTLAESNLRKEELLTRQLRLNAEIRGENFIECTETENISPELMEREISLLKTNMAYIENQYNIIEQQITQRKGELAEAKIRGENAVKTLEILNKQIDMTKPLVEKGVESQTDFLRLERDRVNVTDQLETSKVAKPRIEAAIKELESKKNEIKISFQGRAQKELNELTVQISQITERQNALKDQMQRTLVVSPVKGTVKQMSVNTINGVIRPGMDLVEIVPSDDSLIIEAKMRPSDVAFLHPGQTAKIKVTAYDFSIYGGLDGEVIDISADSLMEPNGMPYFLVRIRPLKNYLGKEDKPLKITPGMIVSVDILTGKKSVMDYLLKPIFKAKNQALTER